MIDQFGTGEPKFRMSGARRMHYGKQTIREQMYIRCIESSAVVAQLSSESKVGDIIDY